MIKHKHYPKNLFIIGIPIVLVAAILVFSIRSYPPDTVEAAGVTSSQKEKSQKASAEFSLASVDNWYQGPTNHTSMAAFQNNVHNCFVSAEQDKGQIVTEQNKKFGFKYMEANGYTVDNIATKDMTLHASSGPLSYELNEYNVAPAAGATTIKQGEAYGYVQLDGSYIKIMVQCDQASQLPAAIPALAAIRFDAS